MTDALYLPIWGDPTAATTVYHPPTQEDRDRSVNPERRYSESDGYEGQDRRAQTGLDFSSLPMWLKAVALVGFPVFMCLFFMGQNAGLIPSPAAKIEPALETTNAKIDQLRVVVEAQVLAQRITSERNAKLLAQICRNGAKSEFQLNSCD